MPGLKKIAVLTSGGDAPGMNAAIRAVTRAALARGWEVLGVTNGYAGLLADALAPFAARDVGGIIQRGGTVLGSARCPEFREKAVRDRARAQLQALGVQNIRNGGLYSLHMTDPFGYDIQLSGVANNAITDGA